MKTLDEVKWNEIDWIKCNMMREKMGKLSPVCAVHTIDNQVYQVEPKGAVFGLMETIISLK